MGRERTFPSSRIKQFCSTWNQQGRFSEKILWSKPLCVVEKQPFPGSCSQDCGFAAEREQEDEEDIG